MKNGDTETFVFILQELEEEAVSLQTNVPQLNNYMKQTGAANLRQPQLYAGPQEVQALIH